MCVLCDIIKLTEQNTRNTRTQGGTQGDGVVVLSVNEKETTEPSPCLIRSKKCLLLSEL